MFMMKGLIAGLAREIERNADLIVCKNVLCAAESWTWAKVCFVLAKMPSVII